MQASTMLQLKIFATKKRLFDGFIPSHAIVIIALLGLTCIVASMVRILAAGASYTTVQLDIPVASAPIQDKSLSGFRESPHHAVEKSTLTVALTPKEFIFGDISAFTNGAGDVRSKFVVMHQDGSPQVDDLLLQINKWQDDRLRRLSIRSDKLLVLIPDSRVPVSIIIKVTKLLQDSKKFDSVVLAGGLI